MRWPVSLLAILLIVPRYSGDERLPLIGATPTIDAKIYAPRGGWPTHIGALEPIGTLRVEP